MSQITIMHYTINLTCTDLELLLSMMLDVSVILNYKCGLCNHSLLWQKESWTMGFFLYSGQVDLVL